MNKMFNFNGMPRKRSGHAGGKGVSMIGMLVLLMAALLVLPSCFDDDTETVMVPVPGPTKYVCPDAAQTKVDDLADCPAPPEPPMEPDCDALGQTEGNDTIQGGSGMDNICGLAGNDMINASGGDDVIDGGDGNDMIYGEAGRDEIMGGAGNDMIEGGPGDDVIDGGAGDDDIMGGAGSDDIMGGAGNDMIEGGPGDDVIDGGDGDDTASYKDSTDLVIVSLSGSIDSRGDAARDTLTNIENLMGSAHDDKLTGDGGDNVITGGEGSDEIDGGAGSDTASYADLKSNPNAVPPVVAPVVQINLTSAAATAAATPGDPPTFAVQVGDAGDDGDDDVILGTTTEEDGATTHTSSIENLTGGDGDDMLIGGAQNNILKGGAGIDTLTGNGGNDTIYGGGGVDIIDGGEGNDMINAGAGADTQVQGGAGNDTLDGGAGNDTLDGGTGSDTYIVEQGDTIISEPANDNDTTCNDEDTDEAETCVDTAFYANYKSDAENPVGLRDSAGGTGSKQVDENIEVVHATRYDDMVTANSTGTTILGHEGNDTLNGGAEKDTLVGCAGENKLMGGQEADVFGVFNDGENADTIADFGDGADEIHLKGFNAGAPVTVELRENDTAMVDVKVDGMTVAVVTGHTDIPVADAQNTAAQNLKAALEDDNAGGMEVTRIVPFDSTKCVSP